MTVAIDKVSGRVVGQVLEPRYVQDEAPKSWPLTILTRDGVKAISRESVRLEETE